ncbi:MAG: uridine kinase [Deltaproteobacteria bacterium]|nr:uridine kinase [Deltaproteobacteria bacterium]
MTPIVLGIAGGSGSGKTTVARSLLERVGSARVAYLEHDNYYRDQSHLSEEERAQVNFDHPDSFDTPLMVEHIRALKRGELIRKPVYSYIHHARTGEVIPVESRPLIIVEGILALENAELRALMDVKIFVDTEDDVRLVRRLRRDIVERGRSLERVLGQYEATVRPMHLTFVLPSRRYADVIVPRGGGNVVAIQMVADSVLQRLGGEGRGEHAAGGRASETP